MSIAKLGWHRSCCGLETENVAHRIKSVRLPLEPGGRTQRPASKRLTALGAMGQLQPLALTAKNHRMIANRIARANGQYYLSDHADERR